MLQLNKRTTCRTCLEQHKPLISINQKIEAFESQTAMDVLKSFTFINISDDNFPQMICVDCYKKIHSFYDFKLRCEVSEMNIAKYLAENALRQTVEPNENDETLESNVDDESDCIEDIKTDEITIDEFVDDQIKIENVKEDEISEETIVNYLAENAMCQSTEQIEKDETLESNIDDKSYCIENIKTDEITIEEFADGLIKIEDVKEETDVDCENVPNLNSQINFDTISNYNKNESNQTNPDVSLYHLKIFQNVDFKESISDYFENEFMDYHNNNLIMKIICLWCNLEFDGGAEYLKHATSEHESKSVLESKIYTDSTILLYQVYHCRECKCIIRDRKIFLSHITDHHRTEPLECCECSNISMGVSAYQVHATTHKKTFGCGICNLLFSYKEYQAHIRSHDKESYLCPTCGKLIKDYSNYANHMRIHTGEKPYSCDMCDMSFAQWTTMKTHKQYVHCEERNYICVHCSSSFKSKHALVAHLRWHVKEKKYECVVCGQKFPTSGICKEHQNVHSEERAHSCPVCNRSYKRKTALRLHMKSHSGKRENVCSICNKSFAQRHVLQTHIKTQHKNVSSN